MKKYIAFIPLILFLLIVIFLWRGLSMDPRDVPSALIGQPVTEFLLAPLLPNNVDFSEQQLLGEVSVVNVWASWCPPCLDEHPILMNIARETDIPIYGINYKDEHSDALQWLGRYGNPFTHIGYDPDGKVAMDWGVYGVPETFIVDAKGIIRYRYVGVLTQQLWEEEILPLVENLHR